MMAMWYQDDLRRDKLFDWLGRLDYPVVTFTLKIPGQKINVYTRAYKLLPFGHEADLEVVFWVRHNTIYFRASGPRPCVVETSWPWSDRRVAIGFIQGYIVAMGQLIREKV